MQWFCRADRDKLQEWTAASNVAFCHVQALRLGRREDLGYRGDPLRRPIASNEIAWVARALVHASEAANVALGLNRPATEEETAQGGLVQVLGL